MTRARRGLDRRNRSRSHRAAARVTAFALLLAPLWAGACHRDPPPRIRLRAIERCEDGILRAVKVQDPARTLRIFHEQCADLFAEDPCRIGFSRAGRLPLDRQDAASLTACAPVYCPRLADPTLEACRPGFEATPANAAAAWRSLEDAIIDHDARGHAPRVRQALLWFIAARSGRRAPPPPPAMTDGGAAAGAR